MRWAGYGVDPKGSLDWLLAIGKVILNFGAVESQTYLWLAQLRRQVPLPRADIASKFARRVDLILELAASHVTVTPHMTAVTVAWARAKALSRFRNQIAHNPLVFGWRGEEKGAPDFLTILDFQRSNQPSKDDPSISLAQINAKIDEIAATAEELHRVYKMIWPRGE